MQTFKDPMTRWTALGVVLLGVFGFITYWTTQRKFVEASVNVVGVERAELKDGDDYMAFAVNCLLNNSGSVALSIVSAQPYTFKAVGADRPMTKAGANSLSKAVIQAEGGKQEPFQVFLYFHKSFIDDGVRQQLFVAPPGATGWLPGAALPVKINFEAMTGQERWAAVVPAQQFAFIGGVPKVVNPVDLTPVHFTRMVGLPVRKDLFQ